MKINIINTRPFEQFFPLKFIDLITNFPNNWYGEPVYNRSLDFYSSLLDFFIRFYLEKDLRCFDKLDAEDLHTYSPLGRQLIRQKNCNNEQFRDKYFNDFFNLKQFAVKLIEKFVPGATWRWIGGDHKAHIQCVKICKILVEYQLLTEEEVDEIRSSLYLKISAFRSLENAVKRDAMDIDVNWGKTWREGFQSIREYYAEILIQNLFQKLDKELFRVAEIIEKDGFFEGNKEVSLDKIRDLTKFKIGFVEEAEISQHIREVLFGYLMSQNTIQGETLLQRKSLSILNDLLQLIANINDSFITSLRLIEQNHYFRFRKANQSSEKKFLEFSKDFSKILMKTSLGNFIYREEVLVKQFSETIEKLNQEISKENAYQMQRNLSLANIPLKIFNILGPYAEYCDEFRLLNTKELFQKFWGFFRFFFKENLENTSVFFNESNVWSFENIFYKFPIEISFEILNVFKENSAAIISKDLILDVFFDMLKNFTERSQFLTIIEKNQVYVNLLQTIGLFLQKKQLKNFNWIPEYDIRIVLELIKTQDFINIKTIEDYLQQEILVKPEKEEFLQEKSELFIEKTELFIEKTELFLEKKPEKLLEYLKLFVKSLSQRMTDASYLRLKQDFPKKDLINLIDFTKENWSYRGVLFEIFVTLYVDFKSLIMNHRSSYFEGKEKEFDCGEELINKEDFEEVFELYIREINFFLKQNNENTNEFMKKLVEGAKKLVVLILRVSEEKLVRLESFLEKLEEIKEIFIENLKVFSSFFAKDSEELKKTLNDEKEAYEEEAKKIDKVYKWKLNKLKIRGFAKEILAICEFLLGSRDEKEENSYGFQRDFIDKFKTNLVYCRNEQENFVFEQETKKNEKICLKELLISLYRYEKVALLTYNCKRHRILNFFSIKTQENHFLIQNFCEFFGSQLSCKWNIDSKAHKYNLMETFCNACSISLFEIQREMVQYLIKQEKFTIFDQIWQEFKEILHYLKYKSEIYCDIWIESYQKVLLTMKFYRFFCRNNAVFKAFLVNSYKKEENLPFIWVSLLEELIKTCKFHTAEVFASMNRVYLLNIVESFFVLLAEFCDNSEEMKLRIYPFLYEYCKGILQSKIANSQLFQVKDAILSFFLSIIQGGQEIIVNFHVTTLEIEGLYKVFLRSFQQLMGGFVEKNGGFEEIMRRFKRNKEFSKGSLFGICVKIFIYFRYLAESKSRYELFFREREEKAKKFTNEEMIIFKFFNEIVKKIEISKSKFEPLKTLYYAVCPEAYFLSKETKKEIMKELKDEENLEKKFFEKRMIFELETRINQEGKIEKQALLFENIWFAYFLSLIINISLIFLQKNDYKFVFVVANLEVLVSIKAFGSFLAQKYQILRIFYRKQGLYKGKLSLYERVYLDIFKAFLLQKEALFLFHIICLVAGIFYSEIFLLIDFLSVFRLILAEKKLRNFEKISKNLLFSFVFVIVLVVSFVNLANLTDFDYDLFAKFLWTCGFSLWILWLFIPFLLENFQRKSKNRKFLSNFMLKILYFYFSMKKLKVF